jgi:hypothetical protein
MPPKQYEGWYVFEDIKDFPDGMYQYDYYVWKIKTKGSIL